MTAVDGTIYESDSLSPAAWSEMVFSDPGNRDIPSLSTSSFGELAVEQTTRPLEPRYLANEKTIDPAGSTCCGSCGSGGSCEGCGGNCAGTHSGEDDTIGFIDIDPWCSDDQLCDTIDDWWGQDDCPCLRLYDEALACINMMGRLENCWSRVNAYYECVRRAKPEQRKKCPELPWPRLLGKKVPQCCICVYCRPVSGLSWFFDHCAIVKRNECEPKNPDFNLQIFEMLNMNKGVVAGVGASEKPPNLLAQFGAVVVARTSTKRLADTETEFWACECWDCVPVENIEGGGTYYIPPAECNCITTREVSTYPYRRQYALPVIGPNSNTFAKYYVNRCFSKPIPRPPGSAGWRFRPPGRPESWPSRRGGRLAAPGDRRLSREAQEAERNQ